MNKKLLVDFTNLMVEHFESQGSDTFFFHDGTRQNKNILEVYLDDGNFAFYVKESNLEVGFWGINPKYLREIEDTKANWFVILLPGSSEVGYLIPADELIAYIQNDTFSTSKSGDYKVHERELDQKFLFNNFGELLSRI